MTAMKTIFEYIKKNLLALVGVLGTIIFGIITIIENPNISIFIFTSLILLALLILVYGKWRIEIIKRKKPKNNHKRFEKIINNGLDENNNKIKKVLKYLSIDYEPFFLEQKLANGSILKTGIGFDIMKRIFEPFDVRFEKFKKNGKRHYNWDSIFKEFSNKKNNIDFIMTPMYETRSRLYEFDVIYSIPLFYSDIGIYVRKKDVSENEVDLTFKKTKTLLDKKHSIKNDKKWNPIYLKGEISEILGKKIITHETLDNCEVTNYSHEDFEELLKDVANPETSGDVVFMEVFKALSIIKKNKLGGKLVNILQDNQLLYPVSFVIRKEETVLRNFINLRIAELRLNGELERIIYKNATQFNIPENKIKDRFLQTYNYKLIDDEYVDSQIMFSDKIREEYSILDNVYGNYIIFQNNIAGLVKQFRKNEQLNVLEIGCGTGITTKILLESRNDFEKVIILDNDDEMVRACKVYINDNVLKINRLNIDYNNSDILQYLKSYKGKSFDLVISGYTIHNFKSTYREELFAELYKNMSDNSLFINADKYAHNTINERIDSLIHRINKFTQYLKTHKNKYDVVEEWISHYVNDMSEDKVMTQKASIELLNRLKFLEVKIDVPKEIKAIEMMAILTAKKDLKKTKSKGSPAHNNVYS